MPDIYYYILTAFGVGLLGILGAYSIQRYIGRKRTGKELITAFDETIRTINTYDGHFYLMENILLREFEGQKIAAREFKRHLGFIGRYRFGKAWTKYHGGDDNAPYFRNYMMKNDIQDSLLSRINKILEFTK